MGSSVQTYAGARVRAQAAGVRLANPRLTALAMLSSDLAAVLSGGAMGVLAWSWVQPAVDWAAYLDFWPASLAYLAAYAMFGLYPGVGVSPVEELRQSCLATSAVSLAASAALVLTREAGFSRGVLLTTWLFTLVSVPLYRAALKACLAAQSWWGAPVAVIGAGESGRSVIRSLRQQPGLGLKPAAVFDDDPERGPECEGVPLAGPLAEAPDWGRTHHVSYALVAMPGLRRPELLRVLERCSTGFSHMIVLPDLFGMASLWVSARDLGGVLGLELRQNLLSPFNRRLKRAMDVVLALAAGALTLPLIAAAAWWIRRASPGRALFVQERGGESGRTIRVYKLRTMRPDADSVLDRYLTENPAAQQEWNRHCKLRNDPRLIPGIGKLLRRTSLDELPQLWNVLKGEMSLVGPRPFPHYHLERFSPEFRALRARVRPGLTGLWQVSARSDGDLALQQALDTYYIRNWSLWLDLHILARTVRAVLFARGAY